MSKRKSPAASNHGFDLIQQWFEGKTMHPFEFQEATWKAIVKGESGLVNAPTGCGKTFSVFIGSLIQHIQENPSTYHTSKANGLRLLWITPLRALATDIARAMETVLQELNIPWRVGIRNGDTPLKERDRQKKQVPEILLITPESLHLLLASKNYSKIFEQLRIVAVDEWHELMGSKRGVQVELALSRLISCSRHAAHPIAVWGISATIGNLEEATDFLLRPLQQLTPPPATRIIQAEIPKQIEVECLYPDEIEKFPWAGHLGIKLIDKVIPVIHQHRTTLIFINTRGMSETWYQALLQAAPELAGVIALHHGSIQQELRVWVEENLHTGRLKAVVCTASLDLGVDFRPVETVIQVGSPKGVARFLQRAGRSGHQPDAISKIYFLPTHSLEIAEVAALKEAIRQKYIEPKIPLLRCFDVLAQYLCTLAVSDGFNPDTLYEEVIHTGCFASVSREEFNEVVHFLSAGGKALGEYDEFRKLEWENGQFFIRSRRTAMRHRMHIGTIVSDAMLNVKLMSGGYMGMVEEYFISRLKPGDAFTLAGRNLELIQIKDMTVLVKKSTSKKSLVPSWNGGRMSLTANLGHMLRETIQQAHSITQQPIAEELIRLQPLFDLQRKLSHIPAKNELLVEQIETREGFHLYVYPFEGRLVHEAMAAITAYRISRLVPISFSIAMNDYGFELLSDQPIPLDDLNAPDIFSPHQLTEAIQQSVNASEMARRKFRDIAVIGGLIFQGMPGEKVKARHLQSNAGLLFNVFTSFDPYNILLRQSYDEVFSQQMEEARLRAAYKRIGESNIMITFPKQVTPFCFPLLADGLNRNQLSSEKLADRIKRLQAEASAHHQ